MPVETCPTFFVTGTDTGVGKTLVTAALARYFSRRGLKVGIMKPIETGVADPAKPGADARLLQWAAASSDAEELIAPYRFQMEASPSQAVEATGAHIDIDRIAASLQAVSQDKALVLVEGAGGLMVPIQGGFLMADLASRLALPLLLITHPRLGTLNHTLLTTLAARTMDLPMAGFLVNRMPAAPSIAEAEAPHLLASFASADLLGVLPEVEGEAQQQIERLADAIGRMPTLPWLTNALNVSSCLSS